MLAIAEVSLLAERVWLLSKTAKMSNNSMQDTTKVAHASLRQIIKP